MRPPGFWWHPPDRPGLQARLLAPLGALTAGATARRVARAPAYTASVPVICVGNLTAGGAGKTPTTIALVQMLAGHGITAHIISRGYGGRLTGPVAVNEQRHSAEEVGDEPLLMAAFAPTWVAKDRAEGARAAEEAGAQALILDDGFQNPSLAKDLSIIVIDAATGFGNGRCLPAGPLREPVAAGMARAQLALAIGGPADQARFDQVWRGAVTVPLARGALTPLETGMPWQGLRALAFAGIGRPEKFFDTLRDLGADLQGTVALDDHQSISPALLRRLLDEARAKGAQLVTTEKDVARIPASMRSAVLTLPVRLTFQDGAALNDALNTLF